MHDSILQSIGKTPLVRLKRLAADVPAAVAVKVEAQNPGGSVKDRVGLAMIVEAERRGLLRPGGTIIEATAGNNGVADRLAREVPGAWRPNQFTNLANPDIHYHSTGPEIWDQTEGKITAFVAGVGTGGSISGVARYLKERKPDVKIVGADPEGSVLSGGEPRPWKVEG